MLLRGKSQVLLRVVCAAFLTVVLFCILLLKVDGQYSLWYYVYSFFPGASAIRAISRFLAFFMFHTLLSCFFTFILFSISRSPFFVYENVSSRKLLSKNK